MDCGNSDFGVDEPVAQTSFWKRPESKPSALRQAWMKVPSSGRRPGNSIASGGGQGAAVAHERPGALVGADQVIHLDGEAIGKPPAYRLA